MSTEILMSANNRCLFALSNSLNSISYSKQPSIRSSGTLELQSGKKRLQGRLSWAMQRSWGPGALSLK